MKWKCSGSPARRKLDGIASTLRQLQDCQSKRQVADSGSNRAGAHLLSQTRDNLRFKLSSVGLQKVEYAAGTQTIVSALNGSRRRDPKVFITFGLVQADFHMTQVNAINAPAPAKTALQSESSGLEKPITLLLRKRELDYRFSDQAFTENDFGCEPTGDSTQNVASSLLVDQHGSRQPFPTRPLSPSTTPYPSAPKTSGTRPICPENTGVQTRKSLRFRLFKHLRERARKRCGVVA